MNVDDHFDEMLDSEFKTIKNEAKEVLPNWVSKSNSSFAAYNAIRHFRDSKLAFIRANSRKSAYVKKSNYLISKTEVARYVGVTPQSMFNTTTYSTGLVAFFDGVNDDLEEKAMKRVHKSAGSHASKRKSELVSIVQSKSSELNKAKQKTVSELMQLTLDRLSLDVRRKLNL